MTETIQLQGTTLTVKSANGQENLHTMRELVDLAYQAEGAVSFLEKAVTSVAPHWHALALSIGADVRSQMGEAGNDEITEQCIKVLDGLVDDEIRRLVKEHDYEGKKLPYVADACVRKIRTFWQLGLDERKYDTLNQMYQAVRDERKRARAAAAEEYKQRNGTESGDESEQAASLSEALDNLPDGVKAMLPELERALRDAAGAQPIQAEQVLGSCITKLRNVATRAAKAGVDKVTGKDKDAA